MSLAQVKRGVFKGYKFTTFVVNSDALIIPVRVHSPTGYSCSISFFLNVTIIMYLRINGALSMDEYSCMHYICSS